MRYLSVRFTFDLYSLSFTYTPNTHTHTYTFAFWSTCFAIEYKKRASRDPIGSLTLIYSFADFYVLEHTQFKATVYARDAMKLKTGFAVLQIELLTFLIPLNFFLFFYMPKTFTVNFVLLMSVSSAFSYSIHVLYEN